ncbi:MAG: hypothetical protein R2873_06115 [Caldilineaceae bacterium]
MIVPFAAETLGSGNTAMLVNDDVTTSTAVAWGGVDMDDDGFTLHLVDPLHFAKMGEFNKWKTLHPALRSDDGRVRLPVECEIVMQDEAVRVDALRVQITAAALNGENGAALEAAEGTPPEHRPKQAVRRVTLCSQRDFVLFFEKPMSLSKDVEGDSRYAPAVVSADQRIRLPLRSEVLTSPNGGDVKPELLGALLRTPGAGDLVSLTHATRRRRRVNALTVQGAASASTTTRIFVPADYLVCSGNHQIEMTV